LGIAIWDFSAIFGEVNRFYLKESVGLVARNTRWRRAPASDKQLRVLHSKKIKVPKGLTKGQASHLISMLP
jgi:hypothetical protein